jgi:single-strand DNA-binding protein
MNIVTMTGNLTRDPEERDGGERPECKLRVAVDNGPYPPTFIDVRTFDAQAEACMAYLRKGRKVGVAGKLALDEYAGKDGSPRQRYSVIGRVEFLDKPWPEARAGGDQNRPVGAGPSAGTAGERQPELALAA